MREYLVMDECNPPYFSKGIVDKNLSDVNTFKEYVNTQIERNGGYTETVKTNVEKTNKESYNDMFFMYEPNSNTPKKLEQHHLGTLLIMKFIQIFQFHLLHQVRYVFQLRSMVKQYSEFETFKSNV